MAIDRRDLATAEKRIEKSRELDPANAEAVANLGFVRHMQGRTDEAVQFVETALAMDPKNPTFYPPLLEAYRQSGDTEGEMRILEIFLENHGGSPMAAGLKVRLDRLKER